MNPRWNVSTEVQIGGHRDIRYTGEDISWYGAMSGPTLNQSHSSTYVSNIVTPPISLPLPLPAPMIHAIFLMAVCISDQDGKLELKEDVMMMGGQSDDSLSLTMWQPTCHSLLGPAVFEGERQQGSVVCFCISRKETGFWISLVKLGFWIIHHLMTRRHLTVWQIPRR